MSVEFWLAVGAVLIIAGLAGYAIWLWFRVWQQQKARTAAREQIRDERNARLARDIEFLAQSLLSGQVPAIEGAIRIKVLLDNYSGPRRAGLELQVFETIYDSTAHIPTHQSWKALSRSERRFHERHMETLEDKHREELKNAASQLTKGLS
jgi:ABC-type nickel/cobalt efflux system permease component RcnA